MIVETKIGDIILQRQTTYYVYANEDEKRNAVWLVSTSNLQEAVKCQQALYKKQLLESLETEQIE